MCATLHNTEPRKTRTKYDPYEICKHPLVVLVVSGNSYLVKCWICGVELDVLVSKCLVFWTNSVSYCRFELSLSSLSSLRRWPLFWLDGLFNCAVSPNWAVVPMGPGSYFLGRPRDKCRLFINSASSTIQKLPKSSSYRTKHLCKDKFVRIAFFRGAEKKGKKEGKIRC